MTPLGQLQRRLDEAADDRDRARRLRVSRRRLEPRLHRDRLLLAQREAEYAAAQAEVDRLESRSVHRLVARLRGSLEPRLERARAEVGPAAERLEEIRTRLGTLALEADRMEGDLALLGEVETPYQEALADVVLASRVSGHADADRIRADAEQRQVAMVQKVEVGTVLPLAEELVDGLRRISEHVDRIIAEFEVTVAYDRRVWDVPAEQQVFHDDPLRRARRQLSGCRETLRTLQDELVDSHLPAVELPTLDGFPEGSPSIYEPLNRDEVEDLLHDARDWSRREVESAAAILADLERLGREVADA